MGMNHDPCARAEASRTKITAALTRLYIAADALNELVGETSTTCVLNDLADRYDAASETLIDVVEASISSVGISAACLGATDSSSCVAEGERSAT